MNETWWAWTSTPESPGRSIALAHFRAAQAAFAHHDETKCLEECRASVEALRWYPHGSLLRLAESAYGHSSL